MGDTVQQVLEANPQLNHVLIMVSQFQENFFQPAGGFTDFDQVTGQGRKIGPDRSHGLCQCMASIDVLQNLSCSLLVPL